jgi:hypothetical protein
MIATSIAASLALALWGLMRSVGSRGRAARAAAVAVAAAAWLAVNGAVPIRGGHDSGDDFRYLSSPPAAASTWAWSLNGKELAPQLLFLLAEAASSRKLEAILVLQKGLAILTVLVLFGLLRRLGHSVAASLLGAGGLLFSFFLLLTTASFSTVNGNLFFLLNALFALAPLFAEGALPLEGFEVAQAGAGLLLLWTSRYELLPPLLAGTGLALWPRLKKARWRAAAVGGRGALIAALAALSLIGAIGFELLQRTTYNGPIVDFRLPFFLPEHLSAHLGDNFWTPLTGLPPRIVTALALALLAGGIKLARDRQDWKGSWAGFISLWCVYSGIIYLPMDLYPLQFTRHHILVFVPFLLLSALIADELLPRMKKPLTVSLCALGLYAGLNRRHIRRLDLELRTNDLEWEFLLDARRHWPGKCEVSGAIGRWRRGVIAKYFPSTDALDGEGCRLIYRSPSYQVMSGPGIPAMRLAEAFLGAPVLETRITHRFYTVMHGKNHAGPSEIEEPIPVSFGFYRLAVPLRAVSDAARREALFWRSP